MSASTGLALVVLTYLAILFWIARLGDKQQLNPHSWTRKPLVYALALGVYCTSWTFYGLVGTAAENGWRFLPILLGPILLFVFGQPLCLRIAALCKQENIRSIADFLAARYGKRRGIAASVTIIMLLATIPYIALQIKAVSETLVLITPSAAISEVEMSFATTCAMAVFALLFGARRLESTGYHSGLMSVVAFESVVKIVALVAVAIFSVFVIVEASKYEPLANQAISHFFAPELNYRFVVETIVSAAAILCLPRMFHVVFVEQLSTKHFRLARLVFPAYLGVIAICIFFITIAGVIVFDGTSIAGDTFVLMLPRVEGNHLLTLVVFIGGYSAATAMIIVATVTLSYMLSNDVILPILVRHNLKRSILAPDYSVALIQARRLTVLVVIGLAYLYQVMLARNAGLTDIGLVAFALAVQLCPAIIFGVYLKKGNANAAYAGLASGCLLWVITLLIPAMVKAGILNEAILLNGIFGLSWLKPDQLFHLEFADAYSRGVTLSLLANTACYLALMFLSKPNLSDKIQARAFMSLSRAISFERKTPHYEISDLSALLVNFLGESATNQLIMRHSNPSDTIASPELMDAAEHALSGVVGITSAMSMIKTLESDQRFAVEDVVNIFGETTKALRFNQDMIAASFESISSAISVVDENLKLVCWNKRYEELFDYPEGVLRTGIAVSELVKFNAERGLLGPGDMHEHVTKRLQHLRMGRPYRVVRNHGRSVVEIKGSPLPTGGYVTTYDDISEFIDAQDRLEKTKLYLEGRVKERTTELEFAQKEAELANRNKSQFLAQASHDILQPLNAASLYASVLLEQSKEVGGGNQETIEHLYQAIQSSEKIISTFLEISKLDTGTIKPVLEPVKLNSILEPLVHDFSVQLSDSAQLNYVPTELVVKTDAAYLRRILQNFLSNAVKYTKEGKIVLGCRRRGSDIEICVVDNGPGIPKPELNRIFDDFYRASNIQDVQGIGLGLAVASRFSTLLSHEIYCKSTHGLGSSFSVVVPRASAEELKQGDRNTTVESTANVFLDKRIYYVDDDEQNVHALSALFSQWGCELQSATSVEVAKRYAEETKDNPPDILLTDWDLGMGVDGINLTTQLRQIWGLPVPACLVSAAAKSDLHELAAANAMEFLRKPIKPGKLRAVMEQVFKRSEAIGYGSKHQSSL